MKVRNSREEDLPAILAIYNDVVATSTAIYRDTPATLEERAAWRQARLAGAFPVLVAEESNGVVGFSSFGDFRGSFAGYRHTVEHTVHVAAEARGRGVGAALVNALFPLAAARDIHVMVGAIDAANEASLRFHDRLGFARAGLLREVGRKFGRWLDLAFVTRSI